MVVLMDISSRCARTSCVSNFGQVVPLCILGYFISWNNPTKVGFYPYPNFLSNEPEDQNDRPAGQTTAFQERASMGRADEHVVILGAGHAGGTRSEEHTYELQSLMRISYAVFCLKNKKQK